jgi:hypothetical protein
VLIDSTNLRLTKVVTSVFDFCSQKAQRFEARHIATVPWTCGKNPTTGTFFSLRSQTVTPPSCIPEHVRLHGNLTAETIFVDFAVLHDDPDVLVGIGDQVDIFQRVAVDQQQIGKRTLLHNPELA